MTSEQSNGRLRHRVLLLTALPVEYAAVRSFLAEASEHLHPDGTIYELGLFPTDQPSWEVVIAEVGKGNPMSGVATQRAIDFFEPDMALFVGVAGGLKDVSIGDVVVATKVYGYESGKEAQSFRLRPSVELSSYRLIQRAAAGGRTDAWLSSVRCRPTGDLPRLHVSPIVAGEKVIASRRSAAFRFIRLNFDDALAVEMEALGFLTAMRARPEIPALVIRGISDLIDKKGESDKAGSQQIAAQNAGAFAFHLLTRMASQPQLLGRPCSSARRRRPIATSKIRCSQRSGSDPHDGEIALAHSFFYPASSVCSVLDVASSFTLRNSEVVATKLAFSWKQFREAVEASLSSRDFTVIWRGEPESRVAWGFGIPKITFPRFGVQHANVRYDGHCHITACHGSRLAKIWCEIIARSIGGAAAVRLDTCTLAETLSTAATVGGLVADVAGTAYMHCASEAVETFDGDACAERARLVVKVANSDSQLLTDFFAALDSGKATDFKEVDDSNPYAQIFTVLNSLLADDGSERQYVLQLAGETRSILIFSYANQGVLREVVGLCESPLTSYSEQVPSRQMTRSILERYGAML